MTQRKLADRYRLVKLLGEGGMGCVWLAYDETLRREVAIKEVVLPSSLPPEKVNELYSRATREARSAARLKDNASVVTIHDIYIEKDTFRPWIIMEHVRYPTLESYIQKHGPLSTAEALRFAKELFETIIAVHAEGVLHRDIKPSNIMLRPNGQPLLIDFGIAKHVQDTAITRDGSFMGTPAFMAPECVNQELSCEASDLWAIGVVLHFVLTGISPFQKATLLDTMIAVNNETPPPLTCTGPLPKVIEGLLHKDHRRRLTAAKALEQLTVTAKAPTLASDTSKSATPAPVKPNRRKAKTSKLPRPFVAAAVVMCVGGTIAYGISGGFGDDTKRPSAHSSATAAGSSGSSPNTATAISAPAETTAATPSSSPPKRYYVLNHIYSDVNFTFPLTDGWMVFSSADEGVIFGKKGDAQFLVKPLSTTNLDDAVHQERGKQGSADFQHPSATITIGDDTAWWSYQTLRFTGCPGTKGSSVARGFPCGSFDNWVQVRRSKAGKLFYYSLQLPSVAGKALGTSSDALDALVNKVTIR